MAITTSTMAVITYMLLASLLLFKSLSLIHISPEREQDVEVQNKLLEEAIEKNPDAILFSPSSFDASDELLQEAKDKGIKITFIDSYTAVSYTHLDNDRSGNCSAENTLYWR